MKILKYVFLLLLIIGIALVVFIATQEGRYDIIKERVIKVPEATLYNYVNDYHNWENIGILTHNDTTAIFTYPGVSSGKGAIASWRLKDLKGEITTIKAIPGDSLVQKAVINGLVSYIKWEFHEMKGATKVSVQVKGELSFTEKAYAVLKGDVQDNLEASLEQGLKNLDNFLVHELNTYTINVGEVVTKTGTFYLKQTAVSSLEETARKTTEMLNRLLLFAGENKISTNGAPFTLYKVYDKQANRAEYAVCIPIKEEIFTMAGSDIEGGRLEPFTALKIRLRGDYSHLKKAWDAGYREINSKGLLLNATLAPIEAYTKSIKQARRPSQWITDIYIPVGQPTVIQAEEAVPMPPLTSTQGTTTTGEPAKQATVKPANTTTGTTQPGNKVTTRQPNAGTGQPRSRGESQEKPAGTTTTRATSTPANKPAGITTAKPPATTAEPAKTLPTQVTE
ncbi:hypothetical protein CHU92_14300 [Flavobacterium cyanobacteriorum]|uniref:Bacterial transcription activator effector binding domain-containing protein n=1 Tax=Flavobacterium cyanobacteriorum TaxID=2022802 RepID=A0A255YSS2_9FLAO|nr:hypothetical protein [Flavobacterium cyanobacteriorum]OYQ32253.1 hypothetical protein CHU92_14300 [Flavobacterium cyanobacteriorum]